MAEPAIIVDGITKTFKINKSRGLSQLFAKRSKTELKTLVALDNISFTVQKGEILGIIGLNGSGKTTLLRILAGVYKPDNGTVQINGTLSPLMQIGTGFRSEFTAKDNIILNGMLLGFSKSFMEKKVDGIIQYAELEKFSNMRIKHYSSGMRSRLAFSIADSTPGIPIHSDPGDLWPYIGLWGACALGHSRSAGGYRRSASHRAGNDRNRFAQGEHSFSYPSEFDSGTNGRASANRHHTAKPGSGIDSHPGANVHNTSEPGGEPHAGADG